VANKKIAKELKRPDHFVDFWTHTWNRLVAFVGPRRKPGLFGLGTLVAVLVGGAVLGKFDDDKRVAASEELARIQHMANAELDTSAPDKNGNRIEEKKDSSDGVPRFATAELRRAAVLKELEQFIAKNVVTGLKDEALVMKGSQLLDAGKFDDAVTAYQAALAAKLDPRLAFLAHEGLGYAYEGKGDFDQALKAMDQLAGDAAGFQGFYRDRALYQKARLTERKGDRAGAVKLYKEVLDKAPDTTLHDEISDRLAVLEAK